MKSIIILLSNTTFGKYVFGTAWSVSSIEVLSSSKLNETTVIESLLENTPAQILSILGIAYGFTILFSKVSKAWKQHQLNKLEVKKEIEHLEQEEISTEIKRKDL